MNADPAWQAYLAKATPFIQQMENRILKILESYFRQMAHEQAHEEER